MTGISSYWRATNAIRDPLISGKFVGFQRYVLDRKGQYERGLSLCYVKQACRAFGREAMPVSSVIRASSTPVNVHICQSSPSLPTRLYRRKPRMLGTQRLLPAEVPLRCRSCTSFQARENPSNAKARAAPMMARGSFESSTLALARPE